MKVYFYMWGFLALALPSFALTGHDFYYEISGSGNPETVVLIHGLGSSAETFRPLIKSLSKQFRMVVYDQRGHGRTPPQGDDYSSEAMAADLETLRQHLKLEKFHLLGHSLGARTAFAYLRIHPDRVRSVVIEDMELFARLYPTPEQKKSAVEKGVELRESFSKFTFPNRGLLEEKLAPLYQYNGQVLQSVLSKKLVTNQDGSVTLTFRPHVSWLYNFQANGDDFTDVLKVLKVPVLVLRADLKMGSAISDEGVDHLIRYSPMVFVQTITGSGHVLHSDKAFTVAEILEKFWTTGSPSFLASLKFGPQFGQYIGAKRVTASQLASPKRRGLASLMDLPIPLQKKFPQISALGLEGYPYPVIRADFLPRGAAFSTDSGALKLLGIKTLLHAVIGSTTKTGGFFDPTLQSIEAAVRNAVTLARQQGHKRVAISYSSHGYFVKRMGANAIDVVDAIVRGAVQGKENLELRFIGGTPGEAGYFRDALVGLGLSYESEATRVLVANILDGKSHDASAIVIPCGMEASFGTGFSQNIGRNTGIAAQIDHRTKEMVSSFNRQLGALME